MQNKTSVNSVQPVQFFLHTEVLSLNSGNMNVGQFEHPVCYTGLLRKMLQVRIILLIAKCNMPLNSMNSITREGV